MPNIHVQHLVEIAVVNIAFPIDAELVQAHQALHVRGAERILEQVHVVFEFAFRYQGAAEASDRHIGDGEKLVELDVVFFREKLLVVLFQLVLRRRQIGAGRIINKGQSQAAVRLAVAELVQALQLLTDRFTIRIKQPPACGVRVEVDGIAGSDVDLR